MCDDPGLKSAGANPLERCSARTVRRAAVGRARRRPGQQREEAIFDAHRVGRQLAADVAADAGRIVDPPAARPRRRLVIVVGRLRARHDRLGRAELSRFGQLGRLGIGQHVTNQPRRDLRGIALMVDLGVQLVAEVVDQAAHRVGRELAVQTVGVLQRAVQHADPLDVLAASAALRDPLQQLDQPLRSAVTGRAAAA